MRAKIYKCDDCPKCEEFTSYVKARAAGWAVSKDYKHVYCPEHAPDHRRGGANNPKRKQAKPQGQLLKGWVQVSIENL